MRVAEKAGTALGALLSNRVSCRMCAQTEQRKEPCTMRNVVYESECATCNPPGTQREADKEGLGGKRDLASLYVELVEAKCLTCA